MKPPVALLHVRDIDRQTTLDTLDAVMREMEFGRDVAYALGARGPQEMMDFEVMIQKQPLYLLTDLLEDWTVIIQAHADKVANSPTTVRLSGVLSRVLECQILTFKIDDDGFSFRIEGDGRSASDLDSIAPLLPQGRTMADLEKTLAFPDPHEQLREFATQLGLQGDLHKKYPYGEWATSRDIPWASFLAVSYFHLRPRQDRRI